MEPGKLFLESHMWKMAEISLQLFRRRNPDSCFIFLKTVDEWELTR